MNIIKEYTPNGTRQIIVIRTRYYTKTLDHIDKLFEELKKDFPDVERAEVRLAHYDGERYKGTLGLEVTLADDRVPTETLNKYTEIAKLEDLL